MISTTIEQSKELLRLGVDINTADMCWMNDKYDGWYLDLHSYSSVTIPKYSCDKKEDVLLPSWSLSALLKLMPLGARLLKGATSGVFHVDCPNKGNSSWVNEPIDAAFIFICQYLKSRQLYTV